MSEKRLEQEKITALYERLSHDDELIGDSNSVVNHVYLFDGNYFTLDQFLPVVFRLLEYIKLNHPFTIGGGGRPLSKRKDRSKDIPLANVLCSFYNGMDIEETDGINVRCVSSDAVGLNNLTDPEEVEFFRTHYVYDFTRGNIVSDIRGAVIHSNGHIVVDYPAMSVKCDGKNFCTLYDQKLCSLLTAVPNWNLVRGALTTNVGTGESGKSIFVPYASIIVAYHRELVPNDTDNIRDKLKVIDQEINRKHLLVDHLTERKENNYPFLLALTTNNVNDTVRNFRTRIRKPFFFYTAVDHARKICLVWLGIEGTSWERHIVFGDLTEERECGLYLQCFERFKEIAKAAGYFLKRSGDDSLLYYWANPDRMNDKRNPLVQLISKPMSIFTVYHDGVFFDIPKCIKPQN